MREYKIERRSEDGEERIDRVKGRIDRVRKLLILNFFSKGKPGLPGPPGITGPTGERVSVSFDHSSVKITGSLVHNVF